MFSASAYIYLCTFILPLQNVCRNVKKIFTHTIIIYRSQVGPRVSGVCKPWRESIGLVFFFNKRFSSSGLKNAGYTEMVDL